MAGSKKARKAVAGAKTALVLFALFVIVACQTSPMDTVPLARTATDGPQGGAAKSGQESAEIPMAPAVGVNSPGDVTSTAVNSNYRPQASNSVGGHVITAFTASLTAGHMEAIAKDAVLVSIAAEMTYRLEKVEDSPENDTRIDFLRDMYAARSAKLAEAITGSAPNMSSLKNLTVVGIIHGNAGHEERTPTDKESENLPRLLANAIAAARGETVILGEKERSEGETE